jgi:hypothetical protein
MKVGIGVGLCLGIGIAVLSGCEPDAAEATAPLMTPASAPTPLVPESYTALSVPVAATDSPAAQALLSPTPAAALSVAGPPVPSSAIKSNQYHPHWVVDVH